MSMTFFRKVSKLFCYGMLTLILLEGSLLGMANATETVTKAFGGNGGTRSYNLDCGSTGMIVGFMVRAHSTRLAQMVIICRAVNIQNGVLGDEFTRGPSGGFDGGDFVERCEPGRVVTRLQSIVHGQFVDGFVFKCDPWRAATRQTERGGAADINHIVGIPFGVTPSFLDTRQITSGEFVCPENQVAKALRGRSGIYIDSLRFVCDDWNQ